jgi:nicotinate phosphoribosyltransferase
MTALSQTRAGVFSLLDTDLYKLTMQCAVLKHFPTVEVDFTFTNRTPQMRLNRQAFSWLQDQVAKLEHITLTQSELEFLQRECPFLDETYLNYLQNFQLRPAEQVHLTFTPFDEEHVDVHIVTKGLWVETILYEIPLLALTSEAYFKFCDRDWSHEGQEDKAYEKGLALFTNGCMVSEFGSRRRRDFDTQDLVVKGLVRASNEANMTGKLTGTSNVYFAMKYGIPPVGTVAHEWYMGIAAITDDYENANELALKYWLDCFGEGVLGIALTDTFGTPAFFRAFNKPIPSTMTTAPDSGHQIVTYAQVFAGIRQDSGDPKEYVKLARKFYDSVGIKDEKTIVFSDSLDTSRCIEYKAIAEDLGFSPSFGVGTFFTNDFVRLSDGKTKSAPLNIVIKLSHAGGRPAIKISDNIGKNTGDSETVRQVKSRLGYSERAWSEGDETHRW